MNRCPEGDFLSFFCELNSNFGDLISALVAVLAGVIAIIAILHARNQGRVRNAIDFLNQYELDEGFLNAWRIFRDCCDKEILEILATDIPRHRERIRCVDRVLNYYEQLSHAYFTNVFDRPYLQTLLSGQLVPDIDCCLPYIRIFRSSDSKYGDNQTFINLLALYFVFGGKHLQVEECLQVADLVGSKIFRWRARYLAEIKRSHIYEYA